MGFAELAIADIAEEYNISVKTVFSLCDQMGISYKNEQTCLALEDAKALINQILAQQKDKT
jgi:hypothetical protein